MRQLPLATPSISPLALPRLKVRGGNQQSIRIVEMDESFGTHLAKYFQSFKIGNFETQKRKKPTTLCGLVGPSLFAFATGLQSQNCEVERQALR